MSPDGRPLRIVQLAAPDAVGGLERVMQALSIGLHQRGHHVCVAAVMDVGTTPDHPFLQPLFAAGVPVRVLQVPPRGYRSERRQVGALYDELRPDVIHSHGYRPDVLDAGVARRRNIPLVTTLHGSSRMGGFSTIHEWIQLAILRRFDAVVAVSRPLLEELAGVWAPRRKLHFIANAWTGSPPVLDRRQARAKLGLPHDGVVLGWVGRLIEVKAAEVFLDALSRIRDLEWRASVVGDGRRLAFLQERARTLGIAERVTFHGSIFDIAQAFRAFDAFVLSSKSEGTPVVLFEAMAAEVPIVATSVGGVADVLGGDAGLLVPSGDPAAMAAALRDTVVHPERARDRAVAAGRRLAAHYSVAPWIEAHVQLYRSVAGS